jgi:DNA-binding response OmpR family regulator
MKAIILEDNEKLAKYIKKFLEENNFIVDVVHDGNVGLRKIKNHQYDIILLDIMLPGKDGFFITKNLRENNNTTPIIMITALSDISDRVEGLDNGADDYLIKPFELSELLSRLRALLRRPKEKFLEKLTCQDIILNNSSHNVFQKNKEIFLTTKEYLVLEYLIINKNITLTRGQILDHC